MKKKIIFPVLLLSLLMTSCMSQSKGGSSFCDGLDKPKDLISVKEAINLEANYLKKQEKIYASSERYVDEEEVRDFYLSMDKIKGYICYAEQQAKKQGVEASGIRIYLGAYPLDDQTDKVKQTTIFIVPTALQEKGGQEMDEDAPPVTNLDVEPLNYTGAGEPKESYEDSAQNF